MAITEIVPGIHYVGVNDRTTTRFEGLWSLPQGVSYNAYLVVGEKMGAKAISGYDEAKTAGAVRAFVRFVVDGRVDTFNDQVLQRVDYEMKLSAANSTIENGRRDKRKPRYARVPTGAETCDFCLMLASRGFVYRSESTAFASHVHSSCDCRVTPGWEGMEVEGYDPRGAYVDDRYIITDTPPDVPPSEVPAFTGVRARNATLKGYDYTHISSSRILGRDVSKGRSR